MYDAGIEKKAFIYSNNIEGSALAQFYDAMAQDFAVQGALMPDAHKGYGLPIGGVVATKDVIVPSWVGYDQGCGVAAIRTTFTYNDVVDNKVRLYEAIKQSIPSGFALRKYPELKTDVAEYFGLPISDALRDILVTKRAELALGTLGGGNHFLEVGYDCHGDKSIWLIVHSGSRGPGHGCATHYMTVAGGGTKPKEGHFPLSVDSIDGKNYINDLAFMLAYALENRKLMLHRAFATIKGILKSNALLSDHHWMINRNHNHAELKDGLWIHRKGATHAEEGMMGVIPGNMRDGSFIVKGKGNPDSLFSSSHGAGRALGRAAAKRELDVQEFKDTMGDIVCDASQATLDEAPAAYKDIYAVMNEQKDLVEVVAHIRPIFVVKGGNKKYSGFRKGA